MAVPAPRRRNSRALTASALRVEGRASNTAYQRRWAMPWQVRALEYLTLIPELNYASRFYARMLKHLRLYPARLEDNGKKTPIEGDGLPLQVLNRIQDPGGGRSAILDAYGRLMFTTGEGYLFGRDLQSEHEKWSFVWTEELIITDDKITWRPFQTAAQPEVYENGEGAQAYRFWTPHPRRSGEADSPIRASVEGGICEELIILTAAVRATAVQRITNGILFGPQEMSPGSIDPLGDEDPENDPFITSMINHFEAQIENPGSAGAALPAFVFGQADLLSSWTYMSLHDPQTDYAEKELRKEAIERIATGADMPKEVMTGLGSTNHWAARQIQDDMWRSHGAGMAEQFCDDLASAYLQPALREEGYADWATTVVGYDPSEVVVNPDRGKDADEAFDRGAVGYKGYRMMKNIPEEWEQTPEEHDEFLAIKLRQPPLLEGVDPTTTGERGPQPAPASRGRDAAEGPPEPGPNGVSRQDGMSARILGAAELAVIRCRELAGSKIRTYQKNCPDCLEPANGKPNALVASLIGPENMSALGLKDTRKLVAGGTSTFRVLLTSYGVNELTADLLCSLIETHAAATLTTAAVGLPDDFETAVLNGAAEEAA